MKELILDSIRPCTETEEKDKVTFIISEDAQTLKIKTICYDGAKSNENLITIKRDDNTEIIFDSIIKCMKKT